MGIALLTLASATTQPAQTSLMHVISPYMGVFLVAFVISIVATPLMRVLATKNGIVDWPDLKRKNHAEPVAYLGGLAIFAGWIGAIVVGYFTNPENGGLMHYVDFPLAVVLGAGVITLTGLFDDIYGISPRVKVSGQLFAAAALASLDVGTHLVGGAFSLLGLHPAGWIVYFLGAAMIAVFVLGGCNSMNLIDGLDGLAAGVATISSLGFLIIAAIIAMRHPDEMADPVRLSMCLAILGALLGFLPYNFNPATIFMGDTGSLLLGYLCVSAMLMFCLADQNDCLLLVTASLIVFALPIADTSLAIFRRKMRGQGILAPDNEHIHHLLRRAGLSVRKSVLLLYAVSITFAAIGVTMVATGAGRRYALAVFLVVYGFIVVTAYKYGHRHARGNGQPTPIPPGAADTQHHASKDPVSPSTGRG